METMRGGGGGAGAGRGELDTGMAQDAYLLQTSDLILGFRGLKWFSNFGNSCFFLDFGTSYLALFNGRMIYTDIGTSCFLFRIIHSIRLLNSDY